MCEIRQYRGRLENPYNDKNGMFQMGICISMCLVVMKRASFNFLAWIRLY